MGDLGADVIQVEKPGGHPSRNRGPFYKDIPDPEKSLFWFGFCLNKRSITLDIETADGQELFKRLVKTADFVFESFQPGYLDSLGLGYQALSQINPRIILASITHFGQNGPKAHYKGAELIDWASSSTLYPSGDPDRPPCVTAIPLAGQQGALAAVMGALTAHWHRKATGEGQHVDVSIQEVMEWNTTSLSLYWPVLQVEGYRIGWQWPYPNNIRGNMGTACKDGYVTILLGAAALWQLRATQNLHKWMDEEGMLPDWLKGYDWADFDPAKFGNQEEFDRYYEPSQEFALTKTKAEFWRAVLERATVTAPVRDFKDNFEDPHIKARGFWAEIDHPELGDTLTYPGACFNMKESPLTFKRRAPLIGEHNSQILEAEPGMSRPQIESPKSGPVNCSAMSRCKALEGIKVVDFGSMGVSPMTCKHLADYGATAIYIEGHNSPDLTRFTSPYYKRHINGSMAYANWNSSKLSVSINLTKPTGARIAWRLVKWADVISCGRPPERMAKWGFDYESVRRVKPEIIYYHTTNVGTFGSDNPSFGFGPMSTALMGFQHLVGWPDRGPSNTVGVIGDTHNYLTGPIAILAALDYRDRTGKGQLIDLSQIETYLWSESPWILDYTVNGRIATRSGNRYPLFADDAPYGAFPCKERDGRDRWVAICVTCDEQWQAFCKVIGQPELMMETRFATASARKRNEDELEQLVSEWTRHRSEVEVEVVMQAAGVPASAAQSNKDLFEDPHLAERNYFRLLNHTELGPVLFAGPVFRLSKTPDNQSAAPCMGEHNEYVFRELLGMSEEEINQALVEGGITTEYDLPQMGK